MKTKQKFVATILALLACNAIAADTALEMFNSKKSQVQSNQAPRATNSSGTGTSSVGSGSHWNNIIQNQLDNYSFDSSELENRLRTEFNAADSQVNSSINTTTSNISQFKSATDTNINNLSSSTTSKVNSLTTTTNNSITSLNTKVNNVSTALSSSEVQIAQLFVRVKELEDAYNERLACN